MKAAFLAAISTLTWALAASGQNPISLNQATTSQAPAVSCSVPIKSLGSIELYDSVAIIKGRSIEIRQADDLLPSTTPELKGIVVRCDTPSTTSGGKKAVTGLAVFLSGVLINQLGTKGGEDLLFRNEGGLAGDIVMQTNDNIIVRQRSGQNVVVPIASINYIRSPRAFLFTLTGTPSQITINSQVQRSQVEAISFQSTYSAPSGASTPVSVVPEKRITDDLDDDDFGFMTNTQSPANRPELQPFFNRQNRPFQGFFP